MNATRPWRWMAVTGAAAFLLGMATTWAIMRETACDTSASAAVDAKHRYCDYVVNLIDLWRAQVAKGEKITPFNGLLAATQYCADSNRMGDDLGIAIISRKPEAIQRELIRLRNEIRPSPPEELPF